MPVERRRDAAGRGRYRVQHAVDTVEQRGDVASGAVPSKGRASKPRAASAAIRGEDLAVPATTQPSPRSASARAEAQ